MSATLSHTEKVPVLIGIHGGSFYEGSSGQLRPDFILNEANYILVRQNIL